jgi:hypothetical protein
MRAAALIAFRTADLDFVGIQKMAVRAFFLALQPPRYRGTLRS